MSDRQTEQSKIDENKLVAERRAKLDSIRENCSANGHPNTFRRENYSAELQMAFGDHDKESLEELQLQVSVAGRIMSKRGPFMVLQDMYVLLNIRCYFARNVWFT